MKATYPSKCLSESWLKWINPTWKLFWIRSVLIFAPAWGMFTRRCSQSLSFSPLYQTLMALYCFMFGSWEMMTHSRRQFSFSPWSHLIAYTIQVWKTHILCEILDRYFIWPQKHLLNVFSRCTLFGRAVIFHHFRDVAAQQMIKFFWVRVVLLKCWNKSIKK